MTNPVTAKLPSDGIGKEVFNTLEGVATVHFADAAGKDLFVAHLHAEQPQPVPKPASAPIPAPKPVPQPVTLTGEKRTLVAEVQGKSNGLDPMLTMLPIKFTGTKSSQQEDVFLDTGAALTMIGNTAAELLGLPNLGATTVMGSGGTSNVYRSKVTIELGGFKAADTDCIVYNGSGPQLLLGADFFATHDFTLEVNYKTRLVRIWK